MRGQRQPDGALAIDHTAPPRLPDGVEAKRMFKKQHRLGAAVPLLLADVTADRVSSMMPDECRRRVTDAQACVQESPADIDVVPRHAELLIEPTQREQAFAIEGEVAAGDMLGEPVVEHHVTWTPRTGRY